MAKYYAGKEGCVKVTPMKAYKIYKNMQKETHEQSIVEEISKLDTKNEFTLKILGNHIIKVPKEWAENCPHASAGMKKRMFIMESGKVALKDIADDFGLLLKFANIIKGLCVLAANNLQHMDISLENIIEGKNHRLYLIDFGNTIDSTGIFNKKNRYLNAEFIYNPPEHKIWIQDKMNKATLHKNILKNYDSIQPFIETLYNYDYIDDAKKALVKDINACALKTDIFALGIVFYQISLQQKTKEGKALSLELARKFANPNVMKRCTAKEALDIYNQIIAKYTTKKSKEPKN
jgi:serine/threonine protein kinase